MLTLILKGQTALFPTYSERKEIYKAILPRTILYLQARDTNLQTEDIYLQTENAYL